MAVLYLDANRGSDAWPGTEAQPKASLTAMDNFLPGAGGGVYLAADSIWTQSITRAAIAQSGQTQFNGTETAPAFIRPYYPSGISGSKPTIRRQLVPTAADWAWDSTDNFGRPRGWYLQLDYQLSFWDIWIKCGGQYAITTNQSTANNTGLGFINGEQINSASASIGDQVNGMTDDTLRFNVDYGGGSVTGTMSDGVTPITSTNARIYLSGLGLRTQGVGLDPSSVYGPGQIVIGLGAVFSFFNGFNWLEIDGVRAENGGGLILLQAADNSVIQGFKAHDLEAYDTSTPIRINTGSGTAAATYWDLEIYDSNFQRQSACSFKAFGKGAAGSFHNNYMADGNLCSSIGGAVYTQLTPSTHLGYSTPFKVRANEVTRMLNGTGNCTFDGGCYYSDYGDAGTLWEGNIARDSLMAYQVGSGGRSEWHSNISINCEYMANWNNAAGIAANDYRMTNCLHVAAKRGTYFAGQGIVHTHANVMYQVGTKASLVGMLVANNVIINAPDGNQNEVAIFVGDATDWTAGKVTVANNLCVGYSAANQVMSDLNTPISRTSVSNCLSQSTYTGFMNQAGEDFRLLSSSGLVGTGANVTRPQGTATFSGAAYQNPPAVGPHEIERKPDWFAQP